MKIGVVCLHTDPFAVPGSGDVGGMNVVVRHTCASLVAQGVDVEVITRRNDPQTPEREVTDGVTVRRLAVGPPRSVPKGEHEALIEPFAERLSGLGPYDVLHSQHWFSGMAALPVSRTWGIPHVQSFHSIAAAPQTSLAEGERPESPGRLAGEEFLAQHSDAIVAVSHAEERTAVDRLGAAPERVAVVHPGVDTDLFHPASAPPGRPNLLVAARLEPLKGVDLAIEALAHLATPRPVLRIAGGATADGSYLDELASLASGLGVADDVEWLGPLNRDQLAAAMRAASLMLVPSHSETYGLVALEASASGIPVIASPTGGLVEAVRDAGTGVLIPSREPRAWAEVVADLLSDPTRRNQLGAAGRELALGRTWSGAARGVLACYQRLLSPAVC